MFGSIVDVKKFKLITGTYDECFSIWLVSHIGPAWIKQIKNIYLLIYRIVITLVACFRVSNIK